MPGNPEPTDYDDDPFVSDSYLRYNEPLNPSPLRSASDHLKRRLAAFARDCVHNGDMTPAAQRMLLQILGR